METVEQLLQETIEKALPVMGTKPYLGVVSGAGNALRKAVAQQMKEPRKFPTAKYNKSVADEICRRMEGGETLTEISHVIGVDINSIYQWIEDVTEMGQAYKRSKSLQARTFIDKLLIQTESLKSEDALAARVRADVVKWVAARFNPEEFSDVKRIELKGEVTHTHTHQLATEQKKRIAESWLISQEQEQDSPLTPAISAETTGPTLPALEGVAVREICETEQGERPKRKRSALPPAKAKAKAGTGKPRGRSRKVSVDDRVD